MTRSGQRGTQRIRYYDDQLLKADDLQDDVAYEARMRELHVRTVHNTWGVALGFEIDVSKDRDAVLIGPGIAKAAHTPNERLELDQFFDSIRIYSLLAVRALT